MSKYLKFGKFKENRLKLREVVENYQPGAEFTEYRQVKNIVFNLEGDRHHEIDIYANSNQKGQDLYIEVKNREQRITKSELEGFIGAVQDIRKTGIRGYFICYAINGFTEEAIEVLKENDIMYSFAEKWRMELI